MKILILNGSPRKNGTVATLLKAVAEPITNTHETEWIDVCRLDMTFCTACMACRDKGTCVLPEDDAHRVGQKIQGDLFIFNGKSGTVGGKTHAVISPALFC
jgi:multimeric flavodoxin WrbA